jgi:DNA invertase Pin-like site-specific DNA recombinase
MNGKAYSYVRFSTPEQAKGRSQSRQEEACERYCRENGLELATGEDYRFFDAGKSGFRGEHLGEKGQLARFMKLVQDGTIERGSTLIVESLDRLSRQDVWKALPWFMDLVQTGIRVVTLNDGRVYTEKSSEQDLILSIFVLSRAHEESVTKSKRVRDAMRKKHKDAREHKKPMGRMIPLWLDLTREKKFVVLEDRANIVRRIFQLAIDGKGRGVIAKILNAEGVPSFKGKTWGASSVTKVLNNRAVLGLYQPFSVQVPGAEGTRTPAGEPVADYYPRIIGDEVFYQAQGAIQDRKVTGSGTKQSERFNVWQGIAKCVHCGAAMHLVDKGKPPKGRTYLQCHEARKGLCKGKLVRLGESEQVFRGMLARLDASALVKDSSEDIRMELREVQGRLFEKETLYTQYGKLLEASPSVKAAQIVAHLEDEISSLRTQKEALQASVSAAESVSIGYDEYMRRLDLESRDGREKANSFLRRMGVLVHIGREEGYLISQGGRVSFGMANTNGQAAYFGTYFHKKRTGEESHREALRALLKMAKLGVLIPATQVGINEHSDQEDAAEAASQALRGERQPAGAL